MAADMRSAFVQVESHHRNLEDSSRLIAAFTGIESASQTTMEKKSEFESCILVHVKFQSMYAKRPDLT